MYDIIVIGAGTAGLSAAIYAVRAGKSVLVLEGKSYGGQIINTPSVENYPGIKNVSGFEFATNLYEQAIALGTKVEYEKVIKIIDKEDTKLVVIDGKYTDENNEENGIIATEDGYKAYRCKSIIIATGTVNRKLGIDRENELVGKGVSYCATCDGAFYRGKDVAVVGGGSTALEDAAFLSNYCNKVYLIHRRNEFRGEDTLVKTLESKENVEFVLNAKVVELVGEDELSAIVVEQEGQRRALDVAGLFVAVGHAPDNDIFAEHIELDKAGYAASAEDCLTRSEGIFVAGDCRAKSVHQLTTAVGDGSVAALAACSWIDAL
jgi:thioredoxin reductase (NADPH)